MHAPPPHLLANRDHVVPEPLQDHRKREAALGDVLDHEPVGLPWIYLQVKPIHQQERVTGGESYTLVPSVNGWLLTKDSIRAAASSATSL